jgi:hypothetical protein
MKNKKYYLVLNLINDHVEFGCPDLGIVERWCSANLLPNVKINEHYNILEIVVPNGKNAQQIDRDILNENQIISDGLLELEDYIPINIDFAKSEHERIFNIPNTDWEGIAVDLETINNNEAPRTLRIYLLNHLPYAIVNSLKRKTETQRLSQWDS